MLLRQRRYDRRAILPTFDARTHEYVGSAEAVDPYWDKVILLIRGDAGVVDESQYASRIDNSGSFAWQTTSAPTGAAGSLKTTNTGGSLCIGVHGNPLAWCLGARSTDAFTLEWWERRDNYSSSDWRIWAASNASSGSRSFGSRTVGTRNYGTLREGIAWDWEKAVNSYTTTGQWYHRAFVNESRPGLGGRWALYSDGALVVSKDDHGFNFASFGTPVVVQGLGINFYNGLNLTGDRYFRDLRVTRGVARYTSNFTPEVNFPKSGPLIDLTPPTPASLLHFDGTNGSTTFTDESGKAWTRTGDTIISTSQSKFGGASAYFDGTGDGLLSPTSADYTAGTGDFTIEGWVRPNDVTKYNTMFDARLNGNTGIVIYASGPNATFERGKILVGVGGSLVIYGAYNTEFVNGTWSHWAVCRKDGYLYAFVDGRWTGGTVNTSDLTMNQVRLGIDANGSSNPMGGYLDEVRICIGKALYIKEFTPPAAPFT